MSLTVTPDIATLPQGHRARRYLLVTVTAPRVPRATERLPVHLSLVLDRSGSMGGDKMHHARQAALSAVQRLAAQDRFSVVVYDNEVDLLVASTLATAQARRDAEHALATVEARGSTDLSTGWLRGCEQVGMHLPPSAVGRVLLLTDGLANQGIQSVVELEKHAAELRARGVTTSTFGVGEDFNEVLLRKMSTAGGGNFYFIETAQQIEDYMTSETGEALEVVAREARLTVRLPQGVHLKCLSAMPYEKDGQTRTVKLGGLVSEQEIQVLLRLDIAEDGECQLELSLSDDDATLSTTPVTLRFRRGAAGVPDPVVALAAVNAMASAARMKSLELLAQRALGEARLTLQAAIEKVNAYAARVAGVAEVVATLNDERDRLHHMDAMDRKRMYMQNASSARSRSADGFANKTMFNELECILGVPGLQPRLTPAGEICDRLLQTRLVPTEALLPERGLLQPMDEDLLVRRLSLRPSSLHLLFVEQRLHDNWFSHWHGAQRTAVVSLVDVPADLIAAFMAYEVVLHGLRLISPGYDPRGITHEETRGCLFDFCRQRADLEIKLQTADLCGACEAKLVAFSIPPQEVRRACDLIRAAATLPQGGRTTRKADIRRSGF